MQRFRRYKFKSVIVQKRKSGAENENWEAEMFQILTVIQSVAFMRRSRRGHSSKFQQASTPRHQKEARPAEKVQNYSLAHTRPIKHRVGAACRAWFQVPVHTLGVR